MSHKLVTVAELTEFLQSFPDKFIFQISEVKFENLRSQFAILKRGRGKLAHDRFLIIDDDIYHIGASLKDLGKKWFAFSKMEMRAIEMLGKVKL